MLLASSRQYSSVSSCNPSLSALISRSSDPDKQGGILGIAQSVSSVGRILGPVWGGYSYGAIAAHAPFVSAAFVMLAAFVLSLRLASGESGG